MSRYQETLKWVGEGLDCKEIRSRLADRAVPRPELEEAIQADIRQHSPPGEPSLGDLSQHAQTWQMPSSMRQVTPRMRHTLDDALHQFGKTVIKMRYTNLGDEAVENLTRETTSQVPLAWLDRYTPAHHANRLRGGRRHRDQNTRYERARKHHASLAGFCGVHFRNSFVAQQHNTKNAWPETFADFLRAPLEGAAPCGYRPPSTGELEALSHELCSLLESQPLQAAHCLAPLFLGTSLERLRRLQPAHWKEDGVILGSHGIIAPAPEAVVRFLRAICVQPNASGGKSARKAAMATVRRHFRGRRDYEDKPLDSLARLGRYRQLNNKTLGLRQSQVLRMHRLRSAEHAMQYFRASPGWGCKAEACFDQIALRAATTQKP